MNAFSGIRLPWGASQDVAPESIMEDPTPSDLRFNEHLKKEQEEKRRRGSYVPAPFEGVELHQKYDHECFRFAQLPFRSQFWLFMQAGGKWSFIVLLPITVLVFFIGALSLERSWMELFTEAMSGFFSWTLGIPLFCWVIGNTVISYFPHFWFRPPKGPLWELNRRTGTVTVFEYKKLKNNETAKIKTAPFHEFDAYIFTSPDRQGLPMNGLYLLHRYRDIRINFNSLITPDNTTQRPCALWDFFQNFMDVNRPLPDLPLYESHRHLDPTTANHDQVIGRAPRYWIDMDDETFKIKVKEMLKRIDAIDTFSRTNLMANHVKYVD